jgi:hypothetical protein
MFVLHVSVQSWIAQVSFVAVSALVVAALKVILGAPLLLVLD